MSWKRWAYATAAPRSPAPGRPADAVTSRFGIARTGRAHLVPIDISGDALTEVVHVDNLLFRE